MSWLTPLKKNIHKTCRKNKTHFYNKINLPVFNFGKVAVYSINILFCPILCGSQYPQFN